MEPITIDICTRNRYFATLPSALLSLCLQTSSSIKELILYDDTPEKQRVDLREHEIYRYIFDLLNARDIQWKVIFGSGRGQHIGHQIIQQEAKYPLIFRYDDDEILNANVIEILETNFTNTTGAKAGLVLLPNAPHKICPANLISNIQDNCQWYKWYGLKKCEHLYSSYLYRKGIQDFNINLSPVAHTEETQHTYGLYKKGYELYVDPRAVTYHLRASDGGIRSGKQDDWYRDEIAFREVLREYNGELTCLLDSGKGDHIVFKSILPLLKQKYKSVKLAVCYPEIFPEEQCISIAEGKKICNPERHNIFKYMIDHNWKDREYKYAYAELYGIKIE